MVVVPRAESILVVYLVEWEIQLFVIVMLLVTHLAIVVAAVEAELVNSELLNLFSSFLIMKPLYNSYKTKDL